MEDCRLPIERVQKLRELMEGQFKFKVGQVVYFVNAPHNRLHQPIAHIIAERILQECMGGVQIQYRLAAIPTLMIQEHAITTTCPEYDFIYEDKEEDHFEMRCQLRKTRREEREKND